MYKTTWLWANNAPSAPQIVCKGGPLTGPAWCCAAAAGLPVLQQLGADHLRGRRGDRGGRQRVDSARRLCAQLPLTGAEGPQLPARAVGAVRDTVQRALP